MSNTPITFFHDLSASYNAQLQEYTHATMVDNIVSLIRSDFEVWYNDELMNTNIIAKIIASRTSHYTTTRTVMKCGESTMKYLRDSHDHESNTTQRMTALKKGTHLFEDFKAKLQPIMDEISRTYVGLNVSFNVFNTTAFSGLCGTDDVKDDCYELKFGLEIKKNVDNDTLTSTLMIVLAI